MGILPLQFPAGENAASLGLTGEEVYDLDGLPKLLESGFAAGREIAVKARRPDGGERRVPGDRPHRYAAGGALLPARRHLAVRAATIAGSEVSRRAPPCYRSVRGRQRAAIVRAWSGKRRILREIRLERSR